VTEPLLLTKKQAAETLTISERALDRFRVEGEIPTVYLGPRTPRFRMEDLVAFTDAKVNVQPVVEWPARSAQLRKRRLAGRDD
jgi:predicted site-specific integrase-resolvase